MKLKSPRTIAGHAWIDRVVPVQSAAWTEIVSAMAAAVAALAAFVTLTIALVAAVYAKRQVAAARDQLEEARTLRAEQSQPYVVVYAQVHSVLPEVVELIVENIGSTVAHDVTITSQPRLSTHADDLPPEALVIPDLFPSLVPRQQWRTPWDAVFNRRGFGLPDRHEVAAMYRDSQNRRYTTTSVVDWKVFELRGWVDVKSVHHIATSLAALEDQSRTWIRRNRQN